MQKILPLLIIMLAISACASTVSVQTTEHQPHWATVLNKESNLYRLDDKLFRSEQLSAQDYPLLKQNNIQTIVNLRFFDRNDDQAAFGKRDLTLVNTPLMSWSIRPKDVAEVLWQIEQAQQNGAVLVHCYHGADRTGLIAAMYRIIYQNWSLEEAKWEMVNGPYGFHTVWRNMENFFTEQNIQEVRTRLKDLGSHAP